MASQRTGCSIHGCATRCEHARYKPVVLRLLPQTQPPVQVLSPAVHPRALWLAARHVPLRAALDGQWAALLKALADALSGEEDNVRRRKCAPS